MINKKSLSERDICTKFITPAIERAGWNRLTHFLEEVFFTDGKIYVRRSLGFSRSGGYLEYKPMFVENLPIPKIDAKAQRPFDVLVDQILAAKKQPLHPPFLRGN